jgi:hypothetical protein
MAPRYLPVATFQQWWHDETTVDVGLVEAAILTAEQAIDNALQRKMVVVTSGAPGLTTRVYAPPALDLLFIDDCTEVTVVSDNSTTLTVGTDYQLEPLNGLDGAGQSVPYSSIRRLSGYWYRDGHKATVSITARFGWATIPYEVVESCKIIAKDVLTNRNMSNGLVAITEAGGVGSRENRIVREMISHYRSIRSWGIA